jgi:hypothetical protein
MHWNSEQEQQSGMPAKVDPQMASQAMIAVHNWASRTSFFLVLCLWQLVVWAEAGGTCALGTVSVWGTAPIDLGAIPLLPIVAASSELVDCWSAACKEQNRDLHMSSIAVHIEHSLDVALNKDACRVNISMVREFLRSLLQKSDPET